MASWDTKVPEDPNSSRSAVKNAVSPDKDTIKTASPTINVAGLELKPEEYHAAFNAELANQNDGRPGLQSTGGGAQSILRAKYDEPHYGEVKDKRIIDAADAIQSHARAVAAANGGNHYDRSPED